MHASIRAVVTATAAAAAIGSAVFVATPAAQAATGVAVRAPLPAPACGVFAAHRGEHSHWTENSRRSLTAAVATNADYVDIDVRETRDSQLVLMHDATIDRTTSGTGAVVRKTMAQLQAVKLDDGTPLTTLHQDLVAIQASKIRVMLEVKAMSTPLAFQRLRTEVRAFGRQRVIITSFSTTTLTKVRAVMPSVRLSLLSSLQRPVTDFAPYGSISPAYTQATEEWAPAVRQAGYPIYAWTADSPESWPALLGRVDVVSTDLALEYAAWRKTACAVPALSRG